MASVVYGETLANSRINSVLLARELYPMTGADREFACGLESVWDKVHGAKAVLHQIEQHVEATQDEKDAEDLQLSIKGRNSPKTVLTKSEHQLTTAMRQNNQSMPAHRRVGHQVAFHEPLVLYNEDHDPLHGSNPASPSGPYRKFDIVKHHKKMKRNSEAFERLKEKIQRQKQRSSSTDGPPTQKPAHREGVSIVPVVTHAYSWNAKPFIRKVARGPPAPEYKGFCKVEPGPKSMVYSDKKPKVVPPSFKPNESKLKLLIAAGRLKPSSARKTRSTNWIPVQEIAGKMKPKQAFITPSSWRDGQRIAESILGPPPKLAKKTLEIARQTPDSPPTRDTCTTDLKKKQSQQTKPIDLEQAATGKGEKHVAGNTGDITIEDKLSMEARGVLDELHESSSESASEEDAKKQKTVWPSAKKMKERQHLPKHRLSKDPKEAKKFQKVRHYDQSEVQQYIAKQKADRRKKQNEERKASKEAQQRRQTQLEQIYKKQKEVSGKRKTFEFEGKCREMKQVDSTVVHALHKMDKILVGTPLIVDANESDKENLHSRKQPSARFDERMTAFVTKLNQYETDVPPVSKCIRAHNKQTNTEPTIDTPQLQNEPALKFMQKLDSFLQKETVTAAHKVSNPRKIQAEQAMEVGEDGHEPDLTVDDLGGRKNSPYMSEAFSLPQDLQDDPNGNCSSSFHQTTPAKLVKSSEEFVTKRQARAERIAALKAKAETLQERIHIESRKLVGKPVIPLKTRMEEIDAILVKSGHGQSLPIHAWTSETRVQDFRSNGSLWKTSTTKGHAGIDLPDASCRTGLMHLSPSQLPGVVGLRKHIADLEKRGNETDVALRTQSAYRGNSVRQDADEWNLTSGRPREKKVDHQAISAPNLKDGHDANEDHTAYEGFSTSRIEFQGPDCPIKLRSVEEILADMKKKEYCIADPPIKELLSNTWNEPENEYMDSSRSERSKHEVLSDLWAHDNTGTSCACDDFRQDEEKPPWGRLGGDKYSAVNVFAKKYLGVLNKNQKYKKPEDALSIKVESHKSSASEAHVSLKPKGLYSEHSEGPFSKKFPRMKSSEKTSPRFHNTATVTLSSLSEELPEPKKLITSKHFDQKPSTDATVLKTVKKICIGRTSYGLDVESSEASEWSSKSAKNRHDKAREADSLYPDNSDISLNESHRFWTPVSTHIPVKFPLVHLSSEKKFSPAALEQKMSVELNYQDAIEESLRHLSEVERTQGTGLAQQETVSLAQLMKARELQHDIEIERLTLKAKEEALDMVGKRAATHADQDEKLSKELQKMKAHEMQVEAARSDGYFAGSFGQTGRQGSFQTSESIRTREPVSEISKDAENRGEKAPQPKDWKRQDSPPSMMSEHSTTSVRMSDIDTQYSIPERRPSSEEEDDEKSFKELPLGKKNMSPHSFVTESISEMLPKRTQGHDSDQSISDGFSSQSKQEKSGKKQSSSKKQKDSASDSSDTSSVRFDESLTENEIAEISRRAVVPSEIHRQHQRRRSPHIAHHNRSNASSDDHPSISRQKTPRGGGHRGVQEFTIGPSPAGAADSEFVHFMDEMVQQYMMEEEVRSQHQAAMLKLRERAIKEKTEVELAWLEKMKKQVRNKGEDEKMPPIKKKQRAILRRFKMETDEIKKLKAVTKAASQERMLFLQQRKDNASWRAKLRSTEEKPNLAGERTKTRRDDTEDPVTASTPVPNVNVSDLPELDIGESNSELDISSASSKMLKQLKTRVFDEHRLTKREQRLMQRKKQAEQLIAWKKRLDQEEKKVCDIEKQALSAWEKEGCGDKEAECLSSQVRKESNMKLGPKMDSYRESSSGKSPESEHKSPPALPSHSESSITEEYIPIHSGTNSSVISEQQTDGSHRNRESSDGTYTEDYSQSFESLTGPRQTPSSPKEGKFDVKERNSVAEPKVLVMKDKTYEKQKPDDSDSPSATPLLLSKKDEPSSLQTTLKIDSDGKEPSSQRRESVESWSDESFSQTQSETEQSDIECRVRALKEELKRRRMIAEKLKKEQKRRHKDRLKAQEASLRSQIEAYDVFIRKTQNELTQELDNQLHSPIVVGPVAKPQIRSPRKSELAKQSARSLRGAANAIVSPEASPRSGSHLHAFVGKHRTESESSGKSSRSLSFDDEEYADDVTQNGSAKSFSGVVAPLPSKHQEKLPCTHTAPSSQLIHDSQSSGGSTPTEKRFEKTKRLDLTAAVASLSKLTVKPLPLTEFTSLPTSAEELKSHIPVPLKTLSTPSSKSSTSTSVKTPPSSANQMLPKSPSLELSRKSLIPLLVSASSTEHPSLPARKSKETPPVTSPSPVLSEKSLVLSEDLESSSSKKTQKESFLTLDNDISERLKDVSGVRGEEIDKFGAMLERKKEFPEPSEDDNLHGVKELDQLKGRPKEEEESGDEKTPVISPAESNNGSPPRTPTPDIHDIGPPTFDVGDCVLLAGRETGIVRFIGETSFAPGVWIGAELLRPNGKNDGSVNGVRYFTCFPRHGIFAPFTKVSLVSSNSLCSTSLKSSSSQHFEYREGATMAARGEKLSESELGKANCGASQNFKATPKDIYEDLVAPEGREPISSKRSSHFRSGTNQNRIAEELSDRLLSSLLENSTTRLLNSRADKRQNQFRDIKQTVEAKKRKKENQQDEENETPQSREVENIALSSSTKKLLKVLASGPEQTQEPFAEDGEHGENKTKGHESLADAFTGDLLQDTLTKVLEIRRQRAKKWKQVKGRGDFEESCYAGEDVKLDDGREVENILEAKKTWLGTDDEEGEDKEPTVRPVSPIFGASQEEALEEWFEDDIGISSFHKMKPTLNKDDIERLKNEDLWQDGRLIEALSSNNELPGPPPKFIVLHHPEHILRLVEDAVNYYYSKQFRGELASDAHIPDFLFKSKPDELSDDGSDESDQEKKETEVNANHIFKTSLFDMVREIITEIYSTKGYAEEMSQRPIWLKKRPIMKPSRYRRTPKTGEELFSVVSQQVLKIINMSGDAHRLDPRITLKWGSRKKKDKVDVILIQELREEEPEWTNYDEDETTVKMQLTDTVLDMLFSDTVKCLDGIDKRREQRESVIATIGEVITGAEKRSWQIQTQPGISGVKGNASSVF